MDIYHYTVWNFGRRELLQYDGGDCILDDFGCELFVRGVGVGDKQTYENGAK